MDRSDREDLVLRDGEASVAIAADRGAIVTRFDVGEHRVLFMDPETLRDRAKNVRGGIPVLFPTPGKLADDRWSHAGKTGTLKQHGFARDLPWRIAEHAANQATLVLESNDETRARWPWDFTFAITFALRGTTLRLEQQVDNHAGDAMPLGIGFHPYFFVRDADKPRTTITTRATRAFDNVAKRVVELPADHRLELAAPEVDLHLLDHGSTQSTLTSPAGSVRVTGSAAYTHWVVWTLAGRDYVCVEPWTCPGNALNTGERTIVLVPAQRHTSWVEIAFAPP